MQLKATTTKEKSWWNEALFTTPQEYCTSCTKIRADLTYYFPLINLANVRLLQTDLSVPQSSILANGQTLCQLKYRVKLAIEWCNAPLSIKINQEARPPNWTPSPIGPSQIGGEIRKLQNCPKSRTPHFGLESRSSAPEFWVSSKDFYGHNLLSLGTYTQAHTAYLSHPTITSFFFHHWWKNPAFLLLETK